MFYFLHRLVKWFFAALLLAGVVWAWQQREVLEPIYVWYDVYENGGITKTNSLPVIQAEVRQIIDGHTMQVESDKKLFTVRLTGFALPEGAMSPADVSRELQRRKVLREIADDNPVQIQITYSNLYSLLGIVTVGGTNLNMFFLTNGLSQFQPEYIKNLPRDQQFRFFAAARMREKQTAGQTALAMREKQPGVDSP